MNKQLSEMEYRAVNDSPLVPDLKICCPNCKASFNPEAIYRLYRAYLVLTRYNRTKLFSVVCFECGKHTKIRTPLVNNQKYKCRRCIYRNEKI